MEMLFIAQLESRPMPCCLFATDKWKLEYTYIHLIYIYLYISTHTIFLPPCLQLSSFFPLRTLSIFQGLIYASIDVCAP